MQDVGFAVGEDCAVCWWIPPLSRQRVEKCGCRCCCGFLVLLSGNGGKKQQCDRCIDERRFCLENNMSPSFQQQIQIFPPGFRPADRISTTRIADCRLIRSTDIPILLYSSDKKCGQIIQKHMRSYHDLRQRRKNIRPNYLCGVNMILQVCFVEASLCCLFVSPRVRLSS